MRSCSEVSESNHFWANTCAIATAEHWWFRTASVSFLLRVPIKSLAGPPTRNRIVHLMKGIWGLKNVYSFLLFLVGSCENPDTKQTGQWKSKFFKAPPSPTLPTLSRLCPPHLPICCHSYLAQKTGFCEKNSSLNSGHPIQKCHRFVLFDSQWGNLMTLLKQPFAIPSQGGRPWFDGLTCSFLPRSELTCGRVKYRSPWHAYSVYIYIYMHENIYIYVQYGIVVHIWIYI